MKDWGELMPKDKNDTGFPEINPIEDDPITRPMPLHERPLQARIDHEMGIVRRQHERIATAIETFWGHRDCVEYLQQLVLSGGDGAGRNRIGFKSEVLSALINLSNLHKVTHALPEKKGGANPWSKSSMS